MAPIRLLNSLKEQALHTVMMGFPCEDKTSTGTLLVTGQISEASFLTFWQFGLLYMHTPSTASTVFLHEEHSLKRTMHISILYLWLFVC